MKLGHTSHHYPLEPMTYDYNNSQTLKNIESLLIQRWEAGEKKYGNHIDNMVVPTHITGEESWAEMALNEALDGVVYCLKAVEEQQSYEKLRTSASKLLIQYRALQEENKALAAKLREYQQEEYFYSKTREFLGEIKTLTKHFSTKLTRLNELLENNSKVSGLIAFNEALDDAAE
jgi:hypothetical protein